MKKKRNSNIEILRIISMLFIVISHYTVHNGISNYSLPLSGNRYLLELMTLGNIGTILFVLITGYFLIESNKFNLNKFIKLWLQIFFYSVVIYFLLVVFNVEIFSLKNMIKCLLPISFKEYWFATSYVMLYIFHPFINKFLNLLSEKEHFTFIVINFLFFSILNMLTTSSYYGNELIQFIFFYSIGGYVKKYNNKILNNKKMSYGILVFSILSIMISVLIFDILGIKYNIFAEHSTYLMNRTSPFIILFSICLFNIFVKKEEKNNNIINIISSCMFGVYLISDNNYFRTFLWEDLLKNSDYVLSKYLLLHMVVSVLLVFATCCLIEFIRINVIDRIYDKCISRKIDFLYNKILVAYNSFFNKYIK